MIDIGDGVVLTLKATDILLIVVTRLHHLDGDLSAIWPAGAVDGGHAAYANACQNLILTE
jgi:hypothetical protein